MFIPRAIMPKIKERLSPDRVSVIYGPRQVGKTTLINKFLEDYEGEYRLYSGEDIEVQDTFTSQSIEKYKSLLGGLDLLVIDEAQHIDNIGRNLKLIVDHVEDVSIIASGSSSFDLAHQIGEPLTGRKWTYTLYPIAQLELKEFEDYIQSRSLLEQRMVYGSYPEVITADNNNYREDVLQEILNSYLLKDLLELEGLRYKDKISDLLTLLAFQIGQEVSLSELGDNLDVTKETVKKYLNLLEKAFVITEVGGFSRNLRKEVSKTSRYYFYDNGIRNAIIGNFNSLSKRNDIGKLWENYVVMERMKKQAYKGVDANNYFWRTYDQKEIDFVEDRGGKLYGYEIKWSEDKKPGAPDDWLETYEDAEYKVINKENYLDFIT